MKKNEKSNDLSQEIKTFMNNQAYNEGLQCFRISLKSFTNFHQR